MTQYAFPSWQNCHADVVATPYGRTAREFFGNVVCPAISKLQQDAEKYKASSDPVDAFYQNDVEDLIAESLKAFCLSLNSIWERQLRSLMEGVARELYDEPAFIAKCQTLPWGKLDDMFERLRGFKLTYFRAYDDLDTLQLLANVCRHGDGPSLRRLSTKCPDLWPEVGPTMPGVLGGPELERFRADNILITLDLLERLTQAIQSFWNQTEYIYLESLSRKHDSVIKKLEELRPVWNEQLSS